MPNDWQPKGFRRWIPLVVSFPGHQRARWTTSAQPHQATLAVEHWGLKNPRDWLKIEAGIHRFSHEDHTGFSCEFSRQSIETIDHQNSTGFLFAEGLKPMFGWTSISQIIHKIISCSWKGTRLLTQHRISPFWGYTFCWFNDDSPAQKSAVIWRKHEPSHFV